ncbi:MAG TPA: leucine-rich repeat protein [Verrucomicrobiae bacterium]|nr:leucine-rich repeat protein [Verrucomicrobiae bacterium]
MTNSFIQFTATPTNGPPPLTVQFAAPSMDSAGRTITNWSWSFGDGATSGLQNPTHTYTDFANFTPTLAATSSGGAPVLSSGPEIATVTPPNDFLYITNAGTIIINSYVGVGGVVIVPASINGLPVTGVEPFVFLGNKALASITIPGSVATIGEEAFFNCLNLTNVTLNSGLTSIGVDAFAGCDKLTIVTVPNSVINIGVDAFANCSGLTNAIIENGVTSIDGGAFYGCVRLTNVSIPPSVTSIGDSVFDQCSGLTAINVDINNPAYSSQGGVLFDISQASLLEYPPGNAQPSYTVPNTVADIAAGAFGQCLLTNIMLSSSVTNIDDFAFGGSSLVSVTIPGSVLRVGSGAFENCSLLSNVTIQNGVASLGDWAFAGCVIDNVTIPASVKSVGLAPFASNPHLLAITVDPENTSFSSADGILFDHSQTMIIEGPSGLSGHCTLPEGVTSIADSAFYDCESLSAISFPSSLTSIGDNAFQSCGLTSVSVPSAVTNIGWAAFAYCPLGSITILGEPANVQSYAFSYNANLMAIYFWSNAPSVDLSAFLGVESATAYYLAGTTGWTSTFDGFPTVEWNPLIYTATPESGAVPLTVSFAPAAKDYAGHSITGWFWSFGDGSTSVAENPSHTYTQAGAFTPTLTATNNAGQIATGSGPTLITATNAAIFSGLVLNGGFETGDFNGWTLSGYTYALVDDGSILGFTPLGSYQADFETGGSPGYLSQTLSTVAGVNYLLSFWFENPDEDAGQFLVSWNGNTLLDTTNLNADEWTNMQFIVSATRSNTVLQFGFQDDNNALVLDSVDVESNFFQFAATPDRGEPPLNIQFASPSDDSNGHPIISWFWSFGDGAGFSTNQNPLHVYNDMGAFSPSLVATNSLGEAVTGVGASIRVGMDSGLVINGSFETGDFTGWTLSGDDNDAGVDNAEILPFFGDYEALLATGGSTSLLTQDVATIPGAGYAITFHISNPFQDDFRLIVSWNGTTLLDTTNLDADWTGMQFLASATGSTATLEFAFEDDYDFLCLDNVAVTRAEPDITSLGLTPANLLLNATPAVVGETYFIKTSTNLALPPRNWTPIATNTANANGYFTITATNTAIGAAPRQFYIIQALGQ